jgi:tetratricopeptide (TPR) repeat protein
MPASSPSAPQPFALYNPALLTPEALLGEFTARQPLLESLLDAVRQNKPGHAPQHLLLVGPRGIGKTTTLWAVAHRVNRDPALAKAWLPVVFDEESRRVGDLADFWLEAVRQWEHATRSPEDRTRPLLDRPGDDIEDRARQALLGALARDGRRVLFLIDNLNDVLASIRDPEPLHRLRAFLMGESRVMILGGATRYFPEITDLDQPFYDFFRSVELRPLSLEEMKACLLALARTRGDAEVEKTVREREGTLRSLHLLTGGNPRLIKTFYRLIAEGLRGDIRSDLERLLDEFTPYFKSLVDALPMQQQRIFDAIALHWDPVDVAAVARATRVASNQVSAQIRILVKAGHVVEAAGQPKKKNYLLADRFSNIHYLMRHGRAARRRLDWFVAILRLVFPDRDHADTLAKLARQSAECGTDGQRDARDLLFSALHRSETEAARRQLLNATFRESWDHDSFATLGQWLDISAARQHLPESDILAFFQTMPTELRKRTGFKPDDSDWWCKLTNVLEERKAWSLAERAYRKAIDLDPTYAYPWNGLGNLLQDRLHRATEAEAAYRRAIELDPVSPAPWNGLGNVLMQHLGRLDEAEEAFRRSLAIRPGYHYPLNGLGALMHRYRERPEESENYFRQAVSSAPDFAYAWAGLAEVLWEKTERLAEARSSAAKALELAPDLAYARVVFIWVCGPHPEHLRSSLPRLMEWLATHSDEQAVRDFVIGGILQLARLSSSTQALELLPEAQVAAGPFETLRDALLAHTDRAHLDRLAPERRVVAIELLKHLTAKPEHTKSAESSAP